MHLSPDCQLSATEEKLAAYLHWALGNTRSAWIIQRDTTTYTFPAGMSAKILEEFGIDSQPTILLLLDSLNEELAHDL
jgi:hypothetical protein